MNSVPISIPSQDDEPIEEHRSVDDPVLSPGAPPVLALSGTGELRQIETRPFSVVAIQQADASKIEPARAATAPAVTRPLTILPSGWRLTAEIETGDSIHFDCHVVGGILITDDGAMAKCLKGAHLVGTIVGRNIAVLGMVDGDIDASGGSVSIEDGSTVRGKVSYTRITMQGGSHKMELEYVPANQP